MYSPTTDIAKMALMAAGPANARHPKRMEMITPNMTVFTGVLVYEFILYSTDENGRAPSLEKANT